MASSGSRHRAPGHDDRSEYPGNRNPRYTARARIGFAFEPAAGWDGEPANAEPHTHSELVWASPGNLPPDTVDYTAAIITAVERGATFTLNGW